jgi:hypothetical protein
MFAGDLFLASPDGPCLDCDLHAFKNDEIVIFGGANGLFFAFSQVREVAMADYLCNSMGTRGTR